MFSIRVLNYVYGIKRIKQIGCRTTLNSRRIIGIVRKRIQIILKIRFLSCCASILMKISVKKCNIIEIGTKVT